MSTPEQLAWDNLRPVLAGLGLDPRRVENVVGPGHPDVDYAFGNIELKALKEFPKRATTTVKLETYTGEQAGWLSKRWQAGGLAWLMVRVGRAWYLFDGWTALDVFYGMTPGEWEQTAAMIYPGTLNNGRGWGSFPSDPGAHPYSRQLNNWLRWDKERMMPAQRARAIELEAFRLVRPA